MIPSFQINEKSRSHGRKGFLWVAIICFASIVMSCTETGVTTDESGQSVEELLADYRIDPMSVLFHSNLTGETDGYRAKRNREDEPGFVTPLTSLATAPNGDILVGDFGSGITDLNGITDIPLPGVTNIGPLGRGSMWATVAGIGGSLTDKGQAIYRVSRGETKKMANLFAFEEANNPDGNVVESNPFSVQALGGEAALVADAAGNDLLRVNNRGEVEVVAVFPVELASTDNLKELFGCPNPHPFCSLPPEIPAEPVPTGLALGPDGYYYVSELKGFPAPTGESNIWRISPDASGALCGSSPDCEKVFDGGFTSTMKIKFDSDGALYVAELEEKSWFALVGPLGPIELAGGTINRCDLNTRTCTEVASGIPRLSAITIGKDGAVWATKNSGIPGLAEVIKIQ